MGKRSLSDPLRAITNFKRLKPPTGTRSEPKSKSNNQLVSLSIRAQEPRQPTSCELQQFLFGFHRQCMDNVPEIFDRLRFFRETAFVFSRLFQFIEVEILTKESRY